MFTFDVEAAIDAIAAIEAAITLPIPGIQNAYGFGANPAEITDPADFPAVLHLANGPINQSGASNQQSYGQHSLHFDIQSLLLVLESVPNTYPADEAVGIVWWKAIANAFVNDVTESALINLDVGTIEYKCLFLDQPSFGVRQWPPESPLPPLHWYWSLSYTHRFWIGNG